MNIFEVYYGSILIGQTALENGDPPMGIAHGIFKPNPNYKDIGSFGQNQLSIKYNDRHISCSGGVVIEDYSQELSEIHITMLGIPYPTYEEIFPEHVISYNKQFPPSEKPWWKFW